MSAVESSAVKPPNAEASSSAVFVAEADNFDEQLANRTHIISAGDSVMIKLANDKIQLVTVEGNRTLNLHKVGSFPTSELIGKRYGVTYQIVEPVEEGKKAILRALKAEPLAHVEDTDATNELIDDVDRGALQTLTGEEIEELKAAGATAQEIIAKQVERHTSFHLKTEYSKEKYRIRKEKKFGKTFRPLAPTIPNLLAHHTIKSASTVLHLREDTVAQLLSLANIRPGGRYLVVDDSAGLITGAMLDRMGGRGRIISFSDTDCPPSAHILLTQMNFPQDVISKAWRVLNWMNCQEDYNPPGEDEDIVAREESIYHERDKARLRRRRAVRAELMALREELFSGEWDALVVASTYEPGSILETLGKYLAGSAPAVVYSAHPNVLTPVYAQVRTQPCWVNPSISESWLRKYQVLPGRTHPFMSMSGSGGFLLSVLRVHGNVETTSVLATRPQERLKAAARKRQKLADAEAAASLAASSAVVSSAADSGVSTPLTAPVDAEKAEVMGAEEAAEAGGVEVAASGEGEGMMEVDK